MISDDATLTVQQVAELLNTSEIAVLNLIKDGHLEASDINVKPNAQRPRWRIRGSAYGRFLVQTQYVAIQQPKPKRAVRKATKDYFSEGAK